MEVEILSKQSIKPPSSSSSSSSSHPKTHKLSLLDQFIPPVYSPLVIFYEANPNLSPSETSESLKQSLSESLTRFYPLAGKVKDYLAVECNDDGAYYIEAKTATSLSDYLSQRDPTSTAHKFVPSEFNWYNTAPGSYLLVVQVTQFSCGGLAVGLLIAHMIADGTSVSCFLRDWAAISRKSNDDDGLIVPQFDAVSMFPQAVPFPVESSLSAFWSRFFRKARAAPRRFVFDSASITRLKERATSSTIENPTRVEVVSAFLCNSIMAAFRAKSSLLGDDNTKPTLVTQAVDMRRRADPPLSPCLMGNFPWLANKLFENGQDNNLDLASVVDQLRKATDKIDADFVKNLQGEEGLTNLREVVKGMSSVGSDSPNGVDYIGFTSLCNFGAYDQLDFGWGQPIWGTYCTAEPRSDGPLINTVFLVDRRVDKGIEALVILDHEEMGFLVKDQHLLAFASLDPVPYKIGRKPSA